MNILNMTPDEMNKQLSSLTDEELIKVYTGTMDQFDLRAEDKNKALKRMDTGIYDKDGKLIGDKFEEEDKYEKIQPGVTL